MDDSKEKKEEEEAPVEAMKVEGTDESAGAESKEQEKDAGNDVKKEDIPKKRLESYATFCT